MRRIAVLVLLASALPVVTVRAEGASPLENRPPGTGAFISENVEYLGTIPLDSPGVGGRMLKVGKQIRFYVTGVRGLTIYDVTNPAVPIPLGHLPVPHWQNEDVDVSDDGKRVIISAEAPNGIHIIDTSNPMLPREVGEINAGSHTTACADPKCHWLYASTGRIYDARKPAQAEDTGRTWGYGGHALNRDESGIVISDSNPRLVLDPRKDPLNPKILAQGAPNGADGYLQHNNVRVGAKSWKPRNPANKKAYRDEKLRPGELLVGNSESNVNPRCSNSPGGLSTWSMANFDRGQRLRQLHTFRPINGNWVNGDPAINAMGCSGHWFTVRKNIIAASWYEHGVRFVKVDPRTGKMKQVGFFQPVVTEAGAAHWVADKDGNEYVYSVDYARGIDILKFNRGKPKPTAEEFRASWLANLGVVGPNAAAERYVCRLGAEDGAAFD